MVAETDSGSRERTIGRLAGVVIALVGLVLGIAGYMYRDAVARIDMLAGRVAIIENERGSIMERMKNMEGLIVEIRADVKALRK